MQTANMSVQSLIDSEDIQFGDSEFYLEDMLNDGEVDSDSYLFYTSKAGNPFAKSLIIDIKFSECAPEFIESVQDYGVERPVTIIENTVIDGHHRLAVAHNLDMEVPVRIFADWDEWGNTPQVKCDHVDSFGEHTIAWEDMVI